MIYNITFKLGDPYGDGHANTSEYHMEANHSADEITEAYKKFVEKYKIDFIRDVGSDYYASTYLDEEITSLFVKLGIITDLSHVIDGIFTFDWVEEEYLELFEGIIRVEIPDFKWNDRDLNEQDLHILDGAAYGFAYHGE